MYTESKEITELAKKVISEVPELKWIKEKEVKIKYLLCDKAKRHCKKTVCGQCIKVKEIDKTFIDATFYIVIYTPNCEHFTQRQYEILLEHELLHVGDNGKIIPHDYEDFKQITDKYGTEWALPERSEQNAKH